MTAQNASRMYGLTHLQLNKSTEKLSSGYKINRAADNAAGLAISEKMRRQIRGLTRASENAQDGISIVQVADGALNEVHEMLQRGSELMIQAANGTNSDSDREYINEEIQQIKTAIDQVAKNTKFNERPIFPAEGLHPMMAMPGNVSSYELDIEGGQVKGITHLSPSSDPSDPSAVSSGSALVDKIAGEYVPNAVNQIFGTFTSLKDKIDTDYVGDKADKLKLALDITYIDGPSGTLAYVAGSFYTGSQTLASLSMTVDSSDFSDKDVQNGSAKLGKLESTIAHEMMHAVMDAALPSRMYPNGGSEDFPLWFIEGTAQLSGGGYTTGWNEPIKSIIAAGGDVDANIANYLKSYTVEDRVYGHGYLAAAYMGYLASGSGSVDAASIASGMNSIFSELINNPSASLESVVNNRLSSTGKSYQSLINDINNASAEGVAFVKALTQASGAGSVIASGGLGANGADVLAESAGSQKMYIDVDKVLLDKVNDKNTLIIQAGSEGREDNCITMKMFRISSKDLGLFDVGFKSGNDGTADVSNPLSEEGARDGIQKFKNAITMLSGLRSYYGAVQNRLEHTIANLDNVVENTTAAESRIRDTDMNTEMVRFSNSNILQQAGMAMLSQANQSNQSVLSLLS